MLVRGVQTGLPFPAVAGGTRYMAEPVTPVSVPNPPAGACIPLDPWDKPEDGGSETDKPHERGRHGLPGVWA